MTNVQHFFLKKQDSCCGCLACTAICPTGALSATEDEKGFIIPKLDQTKCIGCSKCINVCTFSEKRFDGGKYTGKIFAARALDENILMKTSSGGIGHILAEYFQKNSGTVYGCVITENFEIMHEKAENIQKLDGSKYVQSQMLNVYKQIESDLNNELKVLFFGVDCQVGALKQYLKNKGLSEKLLANLFTVDVLCHGVPSSGVFKEYLKYLEKKMKSKVNYIVFRGKEQGWISAMNGNKVSFENGQSVDMKLFQSLFFSYVVLRESCTNCPSRSFERKADITLSDFWNVRAHVPEAYHPKGCSRVMINTEKGEHIFKQIENDVYYTEVDVKSCDGIRQFVSNPSIPMKERNRFYKQYVKNPTKAFQMYSRRFFVRRIIKSIKSRINL